MSTLVTLTVDGNKLGDGGAKELASSLSLTSLSMRNACVSDEGAKALLANTKLKFIDLTGNNFSAEVRNQLAAANKDGRTVKFRDPSIFGGR